MWRLPWSTFWRTASSRTAFASSGRLRGRQAQARVDALVIVERHAVPRIRPPPELQDLALLLQLARDVAVVAHRDVEPLPLAHAAPQLEGLRGKPDRALRFEDVRVERPQLRLGHGEVGVESD